MKEDIIEGTKEEMKKPKTNFFLKSIECWTCGELKHRLVLTKNHGILCKQCYKNLYVEYHYHFNFFMSSLEIDGFDPDDYNTKTLDSLTEVMHDYYQTYIVDSNKKDIPEYYKNSINFVKEVYLTLEEGGKD